MSQRKPILVLTDLSSRSQPAIQFAAALAQMLSAELHVLHALGLRKRPLRAVMPALSNLNEVLQSADDAMLEQVQRVAPQLGVPTRIVDMDDAARAIQRQVAQLQPMTVVTPPTCEFTADSLARLRAPLIVLRERRRRTHNRIMVISDPEAFDSEVVESAGRWGFWLERVFTDADTACCGPDFDVMLLDGAAMLREVEQRVAEGRADLIALDAATLGNADAEVSALTSLILARSAVPIVIMPKGGVAQGKDDTVGNDARVAIA